MTFCRVPTSVMVQVSSITTLKMCVSPVSKAVAVNPGCAIAAPSYTFVLSLAVNVTAFAVIFTVSLPDTVS